MWIYIATIVFLGKINCDYTKMFSTLMLDLFALKELKQEIH